MWAEVWAKKTHRKRRIYLLAGGSGGKRYKPCTTVCKQSVKAKNPASHNINEAKSLNLVEARAGVEPTYTDLQRLGGLN